MVYARLSAYLLTQKNLFANAKLGWLSKNLLMLPCIGLCVACQPQPNSELPQSTAQSSQAQTQEQATIADNSPIVNPLPSHTAELSSKEIAERLEVSYARASAYTSNECPKLVEFQFSNQSITRQNEQFPKQNCDYIVYLRKGELLKVDVSNEVKAELISPVNFDFANGSYTAPKYDKYTVRLSYDGTRFHPENFKYDVILTKAKSEATF